MARYNDQRDTSFYEDLPLEDTVADNLSILPLSKDSFGVCELCGRVGRREDFCIKNNRFCSQHCYLSFKRRQNCNWKFKIMEGTEHMEGMIPLEPLPQLQSWHASFTDLQARPIKPSAAIVANSYEWKDELFGSDFLAAPVSLFKHAPLHEMWDNTFEGMKVEVKNTDCDNKSEKLGDFFWVATVLKVKGYMGLLRYEGFGSDDSKDFWVNLCCSEVHPVGWCATRGKPLIPPKSIEEKYTDWKKFLVKTLTGARTLPANFYSKLNESLKSRFSVGTIMEVVDKNRISQVKVASVYEIIGKRLHVKYYDSSPEDNGFWCHEDSPLIHPVGWAFRVGHPLDAPAAYCQRVAAGRISPSDATLDMFFVQPAIDTPLFSEGMKLEAIDPLNLSSVCAATVMQILNDGYMMIRIDFYPADASGGDWFCYHQRSPCIFPVGFAMANNITLVPPAGYTAPHFSWEQYLAQCGARAAGRELFAARGHVVSHGFVAGMRLECADLMDPRLVCVATVARLVADLLKVHFDGWGDEYDQWLWAHSTDMYPVGWSRAVGHRLEGPLQPPPRPPRQAKRPTKPRPPKRRKRPPALPIISQPCNTAEDSSQHSDMGDNKNLSPMTSLSEISADIDTRHSEISADIDTRHSEISADIDTRHSELSADMDTRHSELSADMDTRHSEISADMDMRQSEISADLDMRQSEISADLDMRHPEISADLDMRHSEVSADIETRHSEMSDTNDVSMEADSKEYNSIMESDRDADATSESNDPPPESETTPMEIPITTVPMPEMPSPHPHYSDTSSPQLPETPLQPEDMDSNSPQQDYEETESIRTELEQHIEPTQNDKLIPRLVNNSLPLDVLNSIEPEQWTIADVAKFLTINDCQPYCEYFSKIDGPAMLKLSKDEIIELLQMKVGPSLKIFDLIHQLRFKMKQPKRLLGNFK